MTNDIGRPELRRFVVATGRYVYGYGLKWDNEQAIREAMRKHELGTHEMCQGRDGNVIIQYCVPRKAPVKPRLLPWAGPMAERLANMVA